MKWGRVTDQKKRISSSPQDPRRRWPFTLSVGTTVDVVWLIALGSAIATAGLFGAALDFIAGAAVINPIGLCYGKLLPPLPHARGEFVYAFNLLGVRWASVARVCLAPIYVINCVFVAASLGCLLNELIPRIEGPILKAALGAPVHVRQIGFSCFARGWPA